MKDILKQNKAITLIALIITIVVMLILAAITINLTIGENGILKRAKDAALMHKKAQYLQEIELEITDEHLERLQNPKEELFIVSLQKRLQGLETASQESVKVYTKKPWVDKAEINLRTILVVFTVDGYQILIDVDNGNNTANVRENSFAKKGKDCTVTFNGNSGQGSMDSISVTQGLGIELPENSFTKTNYTFVGWYEDEQCEGERHNPGETFMVSEDKTLYAKWSQHAITITYEAGGASGIQMSPSTIEVGNTDNLLAITYTRTGYTFTGWKDQDNQIYTDEQEIIATKDLQLTAQWIINQYTISYELDNGIASNPTTYTVETNTITLKNPTKTGYTFLGWSGTGLTGNNNTNVKITRGSIGDRSFTANWSSNFTLVSTETIAQAISGTSATATTARQYMGKRVYYNNSDDWVILYAGSMFASDNKNHVYLIKNSCINISYLSSIYSTSSNQHLCVDANKLCAWFNEYGQNITSSSNNNARATAGLLNTNNSLWSQFKTEEAKWVIGGATEDLFIESSNKYRGYTTGVNGYTYKNTNSLQAYNATGYLVNRNGVGDYSNKGMWGTQLSVFDGEVSPFGYSSSTYYWLASPGETPSARKYR